MKKITLILLACSIIIQAKATLVIPPKDINEMGQMADLVVYGKATAHVSGNPFFNHFQIQKVIKGAATEGDYIVVREYSSGHEHFTSHILGDVDFKMNTPYLLFLQRNDNGFYMSSMVAMSVFEETVVDGKKVLAHPSEFLDICFTKEVSPNLKGAYDSALLIESLGNSFMGLSSWSMYKAGYLGNGAETTGTNSEEEQLLSSSACPNTISSGASYEHCTTVIGESSSLNDQCTINSPGKFLDNNWTITVITKGSTVNNNPISSLATEFSDVDNAVDILSSLPGININTNVSQRACEFICPTVDGSVFPPVVTNPGTFTTCSTASNEILVLLSNPCSNINLPSNVLGIGGAFAANTSRDSDCHTDKCCNKWKTNVMPYVVINNTAGQEGAYRFTAAVAHELLHACGLGHIDGSCSALMNPMLCNSNSLVSEPDFGLTTLDESCTEWMYVTSGVSTTSPCVPIVPVELLGFEGTHKEGINYLNWSTSSEIDNSHFIVERSLDGLKFEPIAKVQGAGTTVVEQRYDFMDVSPAVNINYYRLKQVDFSGENDYSTIISLTSSKEELHTKIYPSPTSNYLNVVSNQDIDYVEISDLTGRILLRQQHDDTTMHLELSTLVQGTYIIRIQSQNKTQFKRFIKA